MYSADSIYSTHRSIMPPPTRSLSSLVVAGLVFLFLTGCSKKTTGPPDPGPVIPVLTTAAVTNILTTTATCGGTITFDGRAESTARGTCWSLSLTPEIAGLHTVDGAGTGTFTSHMADLIPDTLYYARAYATNGQGTGYGNVQSFRTLREVSYTVSDIDSNHYHLVKIGSQYWLRENLRVTHYRNGDAIPAVTADAQWKNLTTGAYSDYDNLASNGSAYGHLYNWHALNDSRGLCPANWHVASDAEWTTLGNFLGGDTLAGGKLKSTGTIEGGSGLWYAPNTGATNSSGFTGLPGGYRINYGNFYSIGNVAYFWSSSDTASVNAWNLVLDANNGELTRNFNLKTNGFSIRCCKD